MRNRLLSLTALCFLILIGWASPSDAQEPVPEATVECVGQITGPGTATTNGHCLLLSYQYADGAPGPDLIDTSYPQTLVDTDGPGEVLSVELPDCYWQVDLVDDTAVVADVLTDRYYSTNGWLVDALHGGDTVCEPEEVTTTTATTAPTTTVTTAPPVTEPPCHEEDPCWVCSEMGNLICGTTTVVTEPPADELADTGMNDNLFLIALGLSMSGAGLVLLSEDKRRKAVQVPKQ